MKDFFRQLREVIEWAIQYNHSWDRSGYVVLGFWYYLLMIGCLISCIMHGAYLGVVFFSVLSFIGIFIGFQIWKIIKIIKSV